MTGRKEDEQEHVQDVQPEASGVTELLQKLGATTLKPSPLDRFKKCVDAAAKLREDGNLAVMFRPAGAKVGLARKAAKRDFVESLGADPNWFGVVLQMEIIRIAGYLIAGREPTPEIWFGELDGDAKREWPEKVAYVKEALLDEALTACFLVNTETCMPLLDDVRYQVITEDPAWGGGHIRTALVEMVVSTAPGTALGEEPERRTEAIRMECGQEELRFLIQCLQEALSEIVSSARGKQDEKA